MWNERPGVTYRVTGVGTAARVMARRALLPQLFRPYRRNTVLLGTGTDALEAFRALGASGPGYVFPYPNAVADDCLKLRREPGRPDTGHATLLFAGSFIHRKAVDVAARAFERAWSRGVRVHVRYVGEGPLHDELDEQVRASGGRATMHPFASGTDLLEHYRAADAVLLPSRHDGWGLPIHEGLAAGVPVIASRTCGAADLVLDSGCGVVVEPGDVEQLAQAITWVAGLSDDQRARIAGTARSVAGEMTIPSLADTLVQHARDAWAARATHAG
jgi:glycosyltransferase involved in cell wall biosynthesis